MKLLITILLYTIPFLSASAQTSDVLVLKKKNNRTLKTYTTGSIIKAYTNYNYELNGYIQEIKNDTIFILNERTALFQDGMGSFIDTVRTAVAIHYRDIEVFNYKATSLGRQRGFSKNFVPIVLKTASAAFIVLESVNTLYAGDSFTRGNRLRDMGIAAGVFVGAHLWQNWQNNRNRAGRDFQVIYIKAGSIIP